jgi:hypothetical protein
MPGCQLPSDRFGGSSGFGVAPLLLVGKRRNLFSAQTSLLPPTRHAKQSDGASDFKPSSMATTRQLDASHTPLKPRREVSFAPARLC